MVPSIRPRRLWPRRLGLGPNISYKNYAVFGAIFLYRIAARRKKNSYHFLIMIRVARLKLIFRRRNQDEIQNFTKKSTWKTI